MANYMAGVAKLLGVEVGEVFEVYIGGECQGRCRFTKDRVEVSDNHCWYRTKVETLEWLLNGTATIVKLPWKPARHDSYYYPCLDSDELWGCATWIAGLNDNNRLERGLIFKTKEEAVEVAEKMLAALQER